jgi:hypothetical protein
MSAAALDIVARQFDAYNRQDLDAFIGCYAPDVVVANLNGDITQVGGEGLRERYAKTFADFPENRARLVNRIHLGNVVIDHEDVSRGPGKDRFEVIAIYTVSDGLIARVDFAK